MMVIRSRGRQSKCIADADATVVQALISPCRAINHEEVEGREDEYWSIVKEYVRSLLHRMR
jgi:hypothetical protein